MSGGGTETMAPKYEAKEGVILKSGEQAALNNINENADKVKNILDNPDGEKTPDEEEILRAFKGIEGKIRTINTTATTGESKTTRGSSINTNGNTTTIHTNETTKSGAEIKNSGHENGQIEKMNPSEISNIITRIKDGYQVSIIGESDKNDFVEGATSIAMIEKHDQLFNELIEFLPIEKQNTLKKPDKPQSKETLEISKWLNTILAQARALQTIKDIKDSMNSDQDFNKFINNPETKIGITPYQESKSGINRGVRIEAKKTIDDKDMYTILNPIKEIETKEEITNNYTIYKMISGIPNGGNNTKSQIMECQVTENIFKQTGKPDKTKVDGVWSVVSDPTTRLKIDPNINDLVSKLKTRSSSSTTEETIKTTGVDKDNIPQTKKITTSETNWIPGTKIILPTESFATLKEGSGKNGLPELEGSSSANLTSYFNQRYDFRDLKDKDNIKPKNTLNMIKKRYAVPSFT